jgi:hypothetical protein
MGRKELVLDVKEMAVVGFTCECGTQVLFDCSNENSVPPTGCPSCDSAPDNMKNMMWSFKRFYESAKKIKNAIEFHVPISD